MAITTNGVFNVPLYHGTTGLFIDSIKQHGIGAKDPLVDLKAKELMLDLLKLADEQHWKDDSWKKFRALITPYVFQTNIENTFNFTHGETYVTCFKGLAEKYAKESYWGCEHLTYLGGFIWFLGSREVKGLTEMVLNHPVSTVIKKRHDPYLVTINNVNVADVTSEANQNLELHIKKIESLLGRGIHGPQSFKLTKPISVNNITVSKIGSWGEGNKLIYI